MGMLLCMFMATQISRFYTPIDVMQETLASLILFYSWCSMLEISNGNLKITMVLTDNYGTLLFFQIGYMILLQGVFSYLLCFIFELYGKGLIISN
jgi:hypothetical protein